MAKDALNKKSAVFTTNKLDLILRTKLVMYCIWSIALRDSETWLLWKVDQKYLESYEVWCCRRTEARSWSDRVRNEVLQRVMEEKNILRTTKRRKAN